MVMLKFARLCAVVLLLVAVVGLVGTRGGDAWQWTQGALLLDPLRSMLLGLVAGIGTVVTAYSVRNLVGQRRLVRYGILELAVLCALALTVTTTSLVVLAVAWTAASAAIAGMVSHSGTRAARRAGRQVWARLAVGDLLLWVAVIVMGAWLGTWTTNGLSAAVATAPTVAVTIAALLVVSAGVVRSALVPAHRWLPETAEAPSPVSALLHAGVVNGVGVLCLLLWPLISVATTARVGLVILGAATALLATAQMRTRADLKGRLAASTSSQMGYLAIQVGIGLPVAALAHVVGHGVWKAAQFLGAGDAVARARKTDNAPLAHAGAHVFVAVGAASAAVVFAAASLPLAGWPALLAPADMLALGVAVGALWITLLAVTKSPHSAQARTAAAVAIVMAGAGYVLFLRALSASLASTFAEPAGWSTPEGVVVAVVVVTLLVLGGCAAVVDRRLRREPSPRLTGQVARGSLRPLALRERFARRPLTAVEVPPVSPSEVDHARNEIEIASESVGALYPLTSFVASNPLAGLEDLSLRDAGEVAAQLWGSRRGPSGAVVRRALEDGTVSVDDVDAVLQSLPSGSVASTAAYARQLLTSDDPSARLAAVASTALRRAGVLTGRHVHSPLDAVTVPTWRSDRVADVADHCCMRSLGRASWASDAGPWGALRAMAGSLDGILGVRGAGDVVAALPDDPAEAVASLLDGLGVETGDRAAVVGRILAKHPGWVAHLRWRARHAQQGLEAGLPGDAGVDPTVLVHDVVATRLALEVAVAQAFAVAELGRALRGGDLIGPDAPEDLGRLLAQLIPHERDLVSLDDVELMGIVTALAPLRQGELEFLRLRVLERAFRLPLVSALSARSLDAVGRGGELRGQVVTCIDVRSERLRRRLEMGGRWETFGAAGFFGLPLRYVSARESVSERSPALLRPGVTVVEEAASPQGLQGAVDALGRAVRAVESSVGVVFGWAEAVGWLLAPAILARTIWPRRARSLYRAATAGLMQPITGRLRVETELGTLVDAAAGFIATTGMHRFAPMVVICGHGASVTNNPHVAAYDCGACGGSAGDVSARTMVTILNDSDVRAALRERGVLIPDDTLFVAALHDTTTDEVRLLETDVPWTAGMPLAQQFQADVYVPDREEAEQRAADWAQPRPEWGLAGAAAIVIGPRWLTEGLDLDGRVFLQSYRPDLDPRGEVLEQLMAAPAVVAQWITSQYLASVVDPDHYGAGDKTTHNVVGDGVTVSAVLSGAHGDLRLGLPWQAISAKAPRLDPKDGGDPWDVGTRHVPQRLLVVVHADPDAVDAVLARQPSIRRLVVGEWVTLCAVDPESGVAWSRQNDGRWVREKSSDLVGVAD